MAPDCDWGGGLGGRGVPLCLLWTKAQCVLPNVSNFSGQLDAQASAVAPAGSPEDPFSGFTGCFHLSRILGCEESVN